MRSGVCPTCRQVQRGQAGLQGPLTHSWSNQALSPTVGQQSPILPGSRCPGGRPTLQPFASASRRLRAPCVSGPMLTPLQFEVTIVHEDGVWPSMRSVQPRAWHTARAQEGWPHQHFPVRVSNATGHAEPPGAEDQTSVPAEIQLCIKMGRT